MGLCILMIDTSRKTDLKLTSMWCKPHVFNPTSRNFLCDAIKPNLYTKHNLTTITKPQCKFTMPLNEPPACFGCGIVGVTRKTCHKCPCIWCRQKGHNISHCSKAPSCPNCGVKGHKLKNCPRIDMMPRFPKRASEFSVEAERNKRARIFSSCSQEDAQGCTTWSDYLMCWHEHISVTRSVPDLPISRHR